MAPLPRKLRRPLIGAVFAAVLVTIVALALTAFAGGFAGGVPVTVVTQRAGLVMDPEAKVKMLGVQVGRVVSIENRPDDQAVLHLSMDPSTVHLVPENVVADIASSTVFGAKSVRLMPPPDPSTTSMYAGQVLQADQVVVEFNTVFERLTAVLSAIEPAKLNETLGTISGALSGRGERFGQSLADLDAALAKLEPALPELSHVLATAPEVLSVYSETAPDLLRTVDNATRISQTVIDEQQKLDELLVSVIGLADIGNDFLAANHSALDNTLQLLLPTTSLLDRYSPALNCGLTGLAVQDAAAQNHKWEGGAPQLINLLLGHERYRFPSDLPKIGATGGPRCEVFPVKFGQSPPFVVADVGANPFKYNNPGIVLNSDGLKQLLFGPIDGPPRNSAQIGQPG
ncbi:MCE family protein [Mycobacterium sp. NAZ190054]|uniref:MCE family protein n=1 Tax=Mycobacterium sp. NAZ190054 TaxID=1747766 RepID=UPI0007957A7E|nr:MCE family protein [Mycobacterium sp. NAZ190054]KWX69246.1 MCE-family protein [Mycobacterium sp. NAZ190054]